ncbi:hypothetical protein KEM54_002231 [Ascosphaera aggregata]|nr:hypothetical protein KEM54_002231 [Ascosphaera aggregata]
MEGSSRDPGVKPGNTGAAKRTDIIDVQPPRAEDLQPSYARSLHHSNDVADHSWYASMMHNLGACIGFFGSVPCCPCPNPFKSVQQGHVGLVTRFGRLERAVDPGLVKINITSEKLRSVDVRIQIVEVPKQTCMTKDNVTVSLTSVIYYRVVSPHKAAFGITNVRQALIERTQTTLRHVVGARVLQDVVERREEIAQSISEIIEDVAVEWGVSVESILIKDIIFSQELQESLSMAAQSKRIGESKVIAARAEVESAKLMRAAANILSSAPAMQIRYLETMQAMAKSANSKVIFLPAPNQTVDMGSSSQLEDPVAIAEAAGEGPSKYGSPGHGGGFSFEPLDPKQGSMQQALDASKIESI